MAVIASVLRENERRVRGGEAMFPQLRTRRSYAGQISACTDSLPTNAAADHSERQLCGLRRELSRAASKLSTRQPSRSREGVQQLFLATWEDVVVNRDQFAFSSVGLENVCAAACGELAAR
jgi:hypothetical protein